MEPQTDDTKIGILAVPGIGDGLEADMELAALAGGKRVRGTADNAFCLLEDDLAGGIGQLNGEVEGEDVAVACVIDLAVDIGDFLIKEIGSARHFDGAEMDSGGIGLLGGAERKHRGGAAAGKIL